MIKKIFSIILALTLVFQMSAIRPCNYSVYGAAIEDKEFACVCSAANKDSDYFISYGCKNVQVLSSEEAVNAGVPEGYTDNVVKVSGTDSVNGIGLLLDFSAEKIKKEDIKEVTFRLYVDTTASGSYPEVRIQTPYQQNALNLKYSIATNVKQWVDVTIGSDGTNFYENRTFAELCSGGYLNKFNFFIRRDNCTEFFIDSIKVTLNDSAKKDDNTGDNEGDYSDDKEKPVITIRTKKIYSTTGTKPCLVATATDNSGIEPVISYEWSDGSLDEAGRLKKGTHTWTIKAKDKAGNEAVEEVAVYVTDEDNYGTNVIDECASCCDKIHINAKSATCTANGNIDYWYCDDCDRYYSDALGTKEISASSVVIKAKGHKVVNVKGKAASFTSDGLTDGSKCSDCGKIIGAQKKINKLSKPSATKLIKVTGAKKKISVKFKKVKNISGYQLQIATKKSMKKGLKSYKIKASKTAYTIKKLKKKTNYYVRIRTYETINSSTGYSKWSKVVKVKTK